MSDEQYLAVLKASYDYVPQSGDEVEIKEGQLLLLVEKLTTRASLQVSLEVTLTIRKLVESKSKRG
ncbi:hypothetical protein EDB84DRAFT_1473385 [Lactarius hengduanensis]|nr:hypothetical protein EDB84DRAFT_1473385 [Lactarius hengduanensis]